MGTTTYTFLEQGRDINVSAPVVERLAHVLRLTPVERRHLYELAIGDLPKSPPTTEVISESLYRMLDFLLPCPAHIFDYRFDLIAFNRASELVLMYPPDAVEQHYNILEQLCLSPERQKLFSNLPNYMRNLISYFRLTYARYSDDDSLVQMVHNLEAKSELFRHYWSEYHVLEADEVNKPLHLNHNELGKLVGTFNLFKVFGYRDLTLSVLTPLPGTDTLEKIKRALGRSAATRV
jgi:hypothetical protein